MKPPYETEIPEQKGNATGETQMFRDEPTQIRQRPMPVWERAANAIGNFIRDHGVATFFAVALLAIICVIAWAAFRFAERQAERQAKLEERQVSAIEEMAKNGKEQNEISAKHAVALYAIEGLLRVQTGADLAAARKSVPALEPEPPPKGPAATPKRKR